MGRIFFSFQNESQKYFIPLRGRKDRPNHGDGLMVNYGSHKDTKNMIEMESQESLTEKFRKSLCGFVALCDNKRNRGQNDAQE